MHRSVPTAALGLGLVAGLVLVASVFDGDPFDGDVLDEASIEAEAGPADGAPGHLTGRTGRATGSALDGDARSAARGSHRSRRQQVATGQESHRAVDRSDGAERLAGVLLAGLLTPDEGLRFFGRVLASARWEREAPDLADDGSLDSINQSLLFDGSGTPTRIFALIEHHDRYLVSASLRLLLPVGLVANRIGLSSRGREGLERERFRAFLTLRVQQRTPQQVGEIPTRAEIGLAWVRVPAPCRSRATPLPPLRPSGQERFRRAQARGALGRHVFVRADRDGGHYRVAFPRRLDDTGRNVVSTKGATLRDLPLSQTARRSLHGIVVRLEQLLGRGNPGAPGRGR